MALNEIHKDPEEAVEEFNITHAYFIGPKGANLPDFRANINTILDELLDARQNYYPKDQNFISSKARRSDEFIKVRANLRLAVQKVAQLLGEHSAPFWSPRYEAHMCTDLTMSSLLGYFMTMLYNPNNVALEASPMTTLVELRVGQQLCELFGYNTRYSDDSQPPLAWGHITCGGTVANLESIWVARNLKFYPLSLKRALVEGKLKFVANKFKVTPCKKGSAEKLFVDLSTKELLNLRPETVLDLPKTLNDKFGITSKFLQGALDEFNIQTVGREALERHFKLQNPMKYFVSKTRHYSWPKGAAIAGLGSGNMIGVDVDYSARINIALLREKLKHCVDNDIDVYAVVAVIGSTEEGAVDRLSEILALREEFQDKHGLSFLVHADGAWGGYFASMLDRPMKAKGFIGSTSKDKTRILKPCPQSYLDPDTVEDLQALKHCDSITVDPHKAGYIPYPSGSLCYRDGRMRHLVTWSGPYLSQGSAENIGVYGVEGSKPGAAAMATWFSNQTVGLNSRGYGVLLGEATYTSARLSAYYATMTNEHFVCVPFNMLPSEDGGKNAFDSEVVENERKLIEKLIIGKADKEVFTSDEAMKLLAKLGSDTNINAFALNWKDKDGNLNTDLEEANYFMKRIVDKLSITTANTDPTNIPIFLTSTTFSDEDYGTCKDEFMKRIGLKPSKQGLFVIRNVVMSPFPSQMNFIDELMGDFQKEIIKEVEKCRSRNTPGADLCRFLVQGSPDASEVFLVFQTSFHAATRRQQLIFSATLDDDLKSFYKTLYDPSKGNVIAVESTEKKDIQELVGDIGTSELDLSVEIYAKNARDTAKKKYTGNVHFKSVIKSRPLNSANRDPKYPETFTPFYLHGTPQEQHIVHILTKAPNAYMCASNVHFKPSLPEDAVSLLGQGLILGLSEIPEDSLQPLPPKNSDLPKDFFFRDGNEFTVQVWKDPKPAIADGPGLLEGLGEQKVLYTGQMTLGRDILVDVEDPNDDPWRDDPPASDSWQEELDKIGSMLDGSYQFEGMEAIF